MISKKNLILTHPISCAEVHRLCKVVALIKTAVVGPGEGHYKLPRTLVGPVHLRGAKCISLIINNNI